MSSVFANTSSVTVLQGEYRVSDSPSVMFTTVLGSCISACLYDAESGIGGMNHFLLPSTNADNGKNARYGIHAMELLINGVLKKGAIRSRLKAKVFGGAKMSVNLSDIGLSNADFVQRFLRDEGISCVSSSVGGTAARRVRFHPVTGNAQQTRVANDRRLGEQERAAAKPVATKEGVGAVMLF